MGIPSDNPEYVNPNLHDFMPDYELVRVSRRMLEKLLEKESEPVVFIKIVRLTDGTCDMILRNV